MPEAPLPLRSVIVARPANGQTMVKRHKTAGDLKIENKVPNKVPVSIYFKEIRCFCWFPFSSCKNRTLRMRSKKMGEFSNFEQSNASCHSECPRLSFLTSHKLHVRFKLMQKPSILVYEVSQEGPVDVWPMQIANRMTFF